MGRQASTVQLKPHERELKELVIDPVNHDLILSVLGLTDWPFSAMTAALKRGQVKQPHTRCSLLDVDEIKSLPELHLRHSQVEIEGRWIERDGQLLISGSHDYAETLRSAVAEILPPIDDGLGDTVPVTILLPNQVLSDNNYLRDSPSRWQFYQIENLDDPQMPSRRGLLDAAQDESSLLWLRLFMAFRFLGLVKPLQTRSRETRMFMGIARALGIVGCFDYLIKQPEYGDLTPVPRGEIPSFPEAPFYYLLPPDSSWGVLRKRAVDYRLPGIHLDRPLGKRYQRIQLGQPKEKDRNSLERTSRKLRIALYLICQMTSGTAITFQVPRLQRQGYPIDRGITTPTLLLPKTWHDAAMGIKEYNPQGKDQPISMTDDCFESGGLRNDTVSALFADYDTRQGEVLRLISDCC